MGFAIAESLFAKGADVVLIAGPTKEKLLFAGITRIDAVSASDMYTAALEQATNSEILIMSAAVADYTPMVIEKNKIKKKENNLHIELTKTKDILLTLGEQKKKGQILVGFALETNNEIDNALHKLKNKNADCIVLNSLNDANAGFGFDTNKVTILDKSGDRIEFGLKSKKEVAEDIVSFIKSKLND
jgi:phosphopantothenoylcysteine decarboxylase/phosphopantothenate--cysteine ligase